MLLPQSILRFVPVYYVSQSISANKYFSSHKVSAIFRFLRANTDKLDNLRLWITCTKNGLAKNYVALYRASSLSRKCLVGLGPDTPISGYGSIFLCLSDTSSAEQCSKQFSVNFQSCFRKLMTSKLFETGRNRLSSRWGYFSQEKSLRSDLLSRDFFASVAILSFFSSESIFMLTRRNMWKNHQREGG